MHILITKMFENNECVNFEIKKNKYPMETWKSPVDFHKGATEKERVLSITS